MLCLVFADEGWDDLCYWIGHDKKIAKRLLRLIVSLKMNNTTQDPERFTEDWSTVKSITESIDVVCPACSSPAIVMGDSKYIRPWKPKDTKLSCLHCGFSKRGLETKWQGAVYTIGSRSCGRCSRRGVSASRRFNSPPKVYLDELDATCSSCSNTQSVKVTWYCEYLSGEAVDPYMGLPLYMKSQYRGHIIWVYNLIHLSFLERYLKAKLRERNGYSGKYSVIANLPTWMKLAKNREGVLKELDRMKMAYKKTANKSQ